MENKIKTKINKPKFYKTHKQHPTKRERKIRLLIYTIVLIVSLGLINAIQMYKNQALGIDMQVSQNQIEELEKAQAELLKHFNIDLTKDPNDLEGLSVEEHIWYLLDKEFGLSFKERIQAMAIIQCESRFNPYAINSNGGKSLDLGVWQINETVHNDKEGYSRACSFDVYCSTRFAMEKIYLAQGRSWNAWMCSR